MRIAIIGCGNMGTGLAEQLSQTHQISLNDRDWNQAQALAKKIHCEAYQSAEEAIQNAELILLAVKPQNLNEVKLSLENRFKPDQILVSLLAGTPLSILKIAFPNPILVRMMPNLALCCGEGVIGLVDTSDLSNELKQELQKIFSPLGFVYWIKESQVDALTSLTASGPAFIFTLIEAMTEAGIGMGFQAKDAQELILQTIQGCIVLLQKTGKHPAVLKHQIASPGGTTIAGLKVLEEHNIRSGINETFYAAYRRAKELAEIHKK